MTTEQEAASTIESYISRLKDISQSGKETTVILIEAGASIPQRYKRKTDVLDWKGLNSQKITALFKQLEVRLPTGMQRNFTEYTSYKNVQDYTPYRTSEDIIPIPSIPGAYVLSIRSDITGGTEVVAFAIQMGVDLQKEANNTLKNLMVNALHLRFSRE